jgi:hypothetical protein
MTKREIRINSEAKMTNGASSFVIRHLSLIQIFGFALLVCSLICCAGGCNVIGFAAATVGGTSNVPPVYAPAKRPTVVIAENFHDPAASVQDDEPLARYVTDLLKQGDVVPTIDPGEIYVMRHDSPAAEQKWHSMSIAAMGRSVTAQQVIYLSILSIDMEHAPGSNAVRGHADVTVRVVDTESGKTLWPVDASDGYPLNAETRMYHEGETDADVRNTLHKMLADKIVKLFTGYRTD